MNKKLSVLTISVLLIALAVQASAQTIRLVANVPFSFVVNNKTMPAGEYWISRDSNPLVLMIRNENEHASALAVTLRRDLIMGDPASQTKLVFHRYGDQYFLNTVEDGYVGVGLVLPESRLERELTKTAANRVPETVTVMARL